MSTSSTVQWREIVEEADDDERHKDSLSPEVYFPTDAKPRRDSGPASGIYAL